MKIANDKRNNRYRTKGFVSKQQNKTCDVRWNEDGHQVDRHKQPRRARGVCGAADGHTMLRHQVVRERSGAHATTALLVR